MLTVTVVTSLRSKSQVPFSGETFDSRNMSAPDYETFQLGDWELQRGESIPGAYIAYKTFGDPKSPAIVYPTWYSGGTEQRADGCHLD